MIELVVDLIMQTTFAEVDWTTDRMIVLECGHVFTVETLDNLMEVCLFTTLMEIVQIVNYGLWIRV